MVKMHDPTKGEPVRGRDAVNADPLRYRNMSLRGL